VPVDCDLFGQVEVMPQNALAFTKTGLKVWAECLVKSPATTVTDSNSKQWKFGLQVVISFDKTLSPAAELGILL